MSDVGTPLEDGEQPSVETPTLPRTRTVSIFDDPVVRRMAVASVIVTLLGLVTVLSVLLTGVAQNTGPRTMAESRVLVGRAEVSSGTTDTAVWGEYISALVEAGQYATARRVIADGRASLEDSRSAEFDLAEARLARAQGRFEEAIKIADEAQRIMQENLEERIDAGGRIARLAKADGIHGNYHAATLIKADSYTELKKWDEAIKEFDAYISVYRAASDILIDRATAKAGKGDKKGAEADIRESMRFYPDNPEAQEALKRIGVEE